MWTRPDAARVGPEQWPCLVKIRKLDSVATRFRRSCPIRPCPLAARYDAAWPCSSAPVFACHTLNGAGDAKFGPDLNIPHNPTGYLRADLLCTYIGDPQSRRRWSQAKMPGFGPQTLSDADLDALLPYRWYMTVRKIESATLH